MSFTRLDPTDFVVSSDSVTAPAWSNNVTVLTTFYTASASTTGSYYIDVYNLPITNASSSVQFSIAYGRSDGSGSAPLNTLVPVNTPTRISFGQYRNLIYGDAESKVNFGGLNTASVDLIALQVDRNRYKESLFPGTFNLYLSGSDATFPLKLTDNSNQVTTVTYVDGGRVFDIISGSNGVATSAAALSGGTKGYTASGSYGLYLPDIGLILLNPSALVLPSTAGGLGLSLISGSSTTGDASANMNNIFKAVNSGSYFALNSQETISSDFSVYSGQWVLLSFVRSGSSIKIYANTTDITETAGTHVNPVSNTTNPLVLNAVTQFASTVDSFVLDAYFASFMMYSKALSVSELSRNFDSTRRRFSL